MGCYLLKQTGGLLPIETDWCMGCVTSAICPCYLKSCLDLVIRCLSEQVFAFFELIFLETACRTQQELFSNSETEIVCAKHCCLLKEIYEKDN